MSASTPIIIDGEVMLAPAPEGWVVNIHNPTRDAQTIRAIWWTLGVGNTLALLFLGQNLYVKWVLQRNLHLETILLLISWVLGIFVCGWLCDTIRLKTTGTHIWEVTMTNMTEFTLIYYVCSTVYTLQLGLVKCALAFFYRRISPARWWQWTVNGLLGFMICFTIALVLISIFPCQPIAKSWDLTIQTGRCLDRNPIYLTITSTHVLLDLILIVLPIPVVMRLQMGLKQKIALIVVFVIGGLTAVSSALRLSVLAPLLTDPDQTWGMAKALLWIIIETNLLVICASIPTVRRFASHLAPSLISDTFKGSTDRPSKSGRPAETEGFRTFGKGSDRRLNTFGMTMDEENKYHEPHVRPLELRDLQHDEPVRVTVSTSHRNKSSKHNSTDKRKRNDKGRDAASESSFDTNNEGSKNNSTWDPLPVGGDEQAIVHTRTYSVRRE